MQAGKSNERKRVTILFADIVNSTGLISGLDLEESASILDPMLSQMADIVVRHGGFVSGLRGDGIKAVFGVPLTLEDHGERACISALELRELAQSGQARIRVGLHSGEVLVRRLRSEAAGEYDAVGLAVHLAARLEQGARPGSIWISGTTAGLVGGRFNLRTLGKKAVKGIRDEVEVFELLSESNRTRWSARSRQHLSKFVGRTGELARLIALISDPKPVISVLGEAGSGKSRLLHELMRRRELAGWTVLWAEVEADDTHAGLRPFAQMLRAWLKIGRQDNPARVRARLHEHVAAVTGPTQPNPGPLLTLLDLGEDATSAGVQKSQILRSLATLIVCHAESNPILLVVEDVHWLDREGLDLLSVLTQSAATGRLAVIQTSRPPAEPLPGAPHCIALGPLSSEDSGRLLDSRMISSPALGPLRDRILERTGGIPLFIEELAKFSAEVAEHHSAIPDGIHAVIGERVDRLPPSAREVLRTASVIGRELPLQVLCRIMNRSNLELAPEIHHLEHGGFVRIATDGAETRLEFSHVLTREVTLAGLLTTERQAIHGAVMAAYEALYPARLDELVEKLGAHASEACAWEKAEHYLGRAARKAIDRSSHSSAIVYIEKALRCLDRSNYETDTRSERELVLRLLLRTAYNAIGNYRQRLGNLDRAETLARGTGRHETLPSIWVSRASALLQLGQVDTAVQFCETARKAAAKRGDNDAAVIAGYMLSRTYFYAGRLAASLRVAVGTLAVLRRSSGVERHGGGFGTSRVMLLTQVTQSRACLGKFAEGRESAAEALSAARKSQRGFDIGLASYGFGVVQWYAGELNAAVPELERGLAASTIDGVQSIYAPLAALLAYGYFRTGRGLEAMVLARKALNHSEASLYHANWPRLFGAMILDANGLHDEALQLASAALAAARKGRYPVQCVWSDLLLAHLHRGPRTAAASRHLARALADSKRMGLRPCIARALFENARLHRMARQEDEARRLFGKADRLAKAMGLHERAEVF